MNASVSFFRSKFVPAPLLLGLLTVAAWLLALPSSGIPQEEESPQEPGGAGNGAAAAEQADEEAAPDPLDGEVIPYAEANPALGRWIGTVDLGPRVPGLFAVTIDPVEADPAVEVPALSATVHAPAFALFGTEARSVELLEPAAEGPAVAFRLIVSAHGGHRLTLEASLDETHQHASGELIRTRDGEVLGDPLELALRRHPCFEQLDVTESYLGAIELPNNMELDIAIQLGRTEAGTWLGTISIEMQNVRALPLDGVERDLEEGTLRLVMVTLHGEAVFAGTLDDAGEQVRGTFQQAGQEMPFALERVNEVPQMRRPQTPTPPFPYDEQEVRIEHPEGHTLAGTLTLPAAEAASEPFSAVVLLTGSGPHDRDETLMGHKVFAVLADYLTRQGIAVLRCDDRGIGESTGEFDGATTADFASDAATKVDFLREDERIDPERVGLVGHSEGGLKATYATARDEKGAIAFCVLLAAPGVPGDEILKLQQRLIGEAEGAEPEELELNTRIQQRLFPLFRGDLEGEDLSEAVKEALAQLYEEASEEERTHFNDLEEMAALYVAQLGSEWFRYFLRYDPRPDLERIDVPVLAINGMLDTQVHWEQNLPEIWKALVRGGNHNVTLRALEELNHLFQEAETGAVSEYARIEQTFSPTALEVISDWILEEIGLQPAAE